MLEGTSGGFCSRLQLRQSVASSEIRPGLLRVDLVELGKRMETVQTLWAPKCLTALMVEQFAP